MKKSIAGLVSALISFGALVALVPSPALAAWQEFDDVEIKGQVILGGSVFIGSENPTNRLQQGAAAINSAVSNVQRFVTISTVAVTNNQALTLSGYNADVLSLSAATVLSSNTLAAVSSAGVGRRIIFFNSGTNVLRIVSGAPAMLAGGTNSAVLLGQWDTLSVLLAATNRIVQTATSDN